MLLPIDSKVKLCAWDALKEKSALSFLPPPPEYPLRCMAVRVNTPLPVGIAVPSSVPLHISFSVPVSSAVLTVALGLCAGNSPTALYRPLPTINGKVWLKVIVCGISTRIVDNNSMRMRSAVSSIVCFIKAVTNIYAMFAPTNIKCVVIAATIRTRTKGMIVATCSIYICSVVMCRQFSDSFMRYVST